MSRLVIAALRAVVIVALVAAVSVQIVLVRVGIADLNLERPWFYRVLLIGLVVLAMVAIESALVGIWHLVSLAAHGAAVTPRVFAWLDLVIKSAVTGAIIGGIVAPYLLLGLAGSPGWDKYILPISAGVASLLAGVSALGLIVARTLLAQSVAREEETRRMRAELDEVI